MKKILINNQLDLKIGVELFKQEGFHWEDEEDSVSDPFPIVLIQHEGFTAYSVNLDNHTDAKTLKEYSKDFRFVITEVTELLIPHVKEITSYLGLRVSTKETTLTINKKGRIEINLDINTFLDKFDDNLLFKKYLFTIDNPSDLNFLRNIDETINDARISNYKFDFKNYKWKQTSKSKNYRNRKDLVFVRNLERLTITEDYTLIGSNDLRDDTYFINIVSKGFVSTDCPKKLIVNSSGYNEGIKILKNIFFEFANEVYKALLDVTSDTIEGTSYSGETISVLKNNVNIVENKQVPNSEFYVIGGSKLSRRYDLELRDYTFVYEGKEQYYGENIIVPLSNTITYFENKSYIKLLKGDDKYYCLNDFAFVDGFDEMLEFSNYNGEVVDFFSEDIFIKINDNVYDEHGDSLYMDYDTLYLPTFEEGKKLYTDIIKYDLDRFDKYVKNCYVSNDLTSSQVIENVKSSLLTKKLELRKSDLSKNITGVERIDKYLILCESTFEINGRQVLISVTVFGKKLEVVYDIISYDDSSLNLKLVC